MSEQKDTYVPVECGLHSQYELAVMNGKAILLSWMDQDGNQHKQKVRPLDLRTRDRKEYLVVETSEGEQTEIRLDKILSSDL